MKKILTYFPQTSFHSLSFPQNVWRRRRFLLGVFLFTASSELFAATQFTLIKRNPPPPVISMLEKTSLFPYANNLSYPLGLDKTTFSTDFLVAINRKPNLVEQSAVQMRAGFSEKDNAAIYQTIIGNILWEIDDALGTVAALDAATRIPLWSSDGVVFRFLPTPRGNDYFSFNQEKDVPKSNRSEVAFNRIYFLLDPFDRQNNSFRLLVAVDSLAQGRLVWARTINEFAPFFPNDNQMISFQGLKLNSSEINDGLSVFIQRGNTIKKFVLDAATGQVREE